MARRSSWVFAGLAAYSLAVTSGATLLLSDQGSLGTVVNRMTTRVAHHRSPKLLLIGDSLTENGKPWGLKISSNPFDAVAFSQPGSTAHLLSSVSEPESWNFKPAAVSLLAGTNDVGEGRNTPEQFARDQIENIDRISRSGAKVILTLIPPTSDPSRNRKNDAYNAALLGALGKRDVVVIDLKPDMLAGTVIRPDLSADGIHFSPAAYDIWAGHLRQSMPTS